MRPVRVAVPLSNGLVFNNANGTSNNAKCTLDKGGTSLTARAWERVNLCSSLISTVRLTITELAILWLAHKIFRLLTKYYVLLLATGPHPSQKRFLQKMRSPAASFNLQYIRVSLRLYNSCLRLLPGFPQSLLSSLLSFLRYCV